MKSEKFKMFKTLGDAFHYLKKNFARLTGNSVLVVIPYIIIAGFIASVYRPVLGATYYSTIYYSSYSMEYMVGAMVIFIPMAILMSILMAVYIKITDDSYENRDIHYGEQIKFTFKKSGKLILSNVLVHVPLTLIYVVLFTLLASTGKLTFFLLNITYSLIMGLFLLINQSIIIEDVTAIQAIVRSAGIMKHNIFRYFGFNIVIGISLSVILTLLGTIVGHSMIMMIVFILLLLIALFLLMPLPAVFLTLLYKGVPHKPYDYQSTSDYYVDSDDMYFEHDAKSNEGLYTKDKMYVDDKDMYFEHDSKSNEGLYTDDDDLYYDE